MAIQVPTAFAVLRGCRKMRCVSEDVTGRSRGWHSNSREDVSAGWSVIATESSVFAPRKTDNRAASRSRHLAEQTTNGRGKVLS